VPGRIKILEIRSMKTPLEPTMEADSSVLGRLVASGNDQEAAVAEVQRLSDQRRELIADGRRSALRATWHNEAGYIVLSLWRDNVCVATSHLTPREAGRLAAFITAGLAELAESAEHLQPMTARRRRRLIRPSLDSVIAAWRNNVGATLQSWGRRVRADR